jgi:hypothetical protein
MNPTVTSTGLAVDIGTAHHWSIELDFDSGIQTLKRDNDETTALEQLA